MNYEPQNTTIEVLNSGVVSVLDREVEVNDTLAQANSIT